MFRYFSPDGFTVSDCSFTAALLENTHINTSMAFCIVWRIRQLDKGLGNWINETFVKFSEIFLCHVCPCAWNILADFYDVLNWRIQKVKDCLKLVRNIRHLHEDLNTFYIFDSEIHDTIIKKNLLLHFHGKIFNIHLFFHCKSYSCKMAQLIPVLKREKTLTQHIVMLYTHSMSYLLFCVHFFCICVLWCTFLCKQCSFFYLLISNYSVERYQILVILTLLFIHGLSEFPFCLPA
jgi:hypothetical protein